MVGLGLVGVMVLDDCIWTEQERLPTPCCASPHPPSPTCMAAPPFVGPEVSLCCRNAGLASGCLLPGVERTEERRPPAACHLLAGTLPAASAGWRAGLVPAACSAPPNPSLTVAPPLSSVPGCLLLSPSCQALPSADYHQPVLTAVSSSLPGPAHGALGFGF